MKFLSPKGGNVSGSKKLLLSAVTCEFLAYRELLSQYLKRPELDVAVQEDFVVTGGSTLEKLDDYIRACDGIVHLIGKATGAPPEPPAVAALLKRYPDFAARLPPLAPFLNQAQPGFSYTQWEAYLALYHARPLFVYLPADFGLEALTVPRDARFVLDPAQVQAQKEHHLPRGLLIRAWLRSLTGPRTGPVSAKTDLDEAWEIAERGPMPLHMADIHLYRARLFFRETPYPWTSPQHDLAEARRLIFKHGYLRRKEELEDAESAILRSATP